MLRKWILIIAACLCLALMVMPHAARSQDTDLTPIPLAYTTGIIAPDGNPNYSVFIGSGEQALTNVVITMTLPAGSTFQEIFWTPSSAVAVGESGGVVTWTVAEIPAESLLGPFTIAVSFDDPAAEIPATIPATVAHAGGAIEVAALADEPTLTPLADEGSITIDPVLGTEGQFVEVGATGILIEVLPNVLKTAVTFHFVRMPIADDTPLPDVAEQTWWCALYYLEVEPADADLTQGIKLVLPTRRTISPALAPQQFIKPALDEAKWELINDETAAVPTGVMARPDFQRYLTEIVILANGSNVLVQQPWVTGLPSTTQQLALGVSLEDRRASIGPVLSLNAAALIAPNLPNTLNVRGGNGSVIATATPNS